VITRVVDYGGLFHDDVLPGHAFPRHDHRGFRPAGWIEAGRERLERMRPIAERHGLTPLQLACQWNLAHAPVHVVAPTLIEEPGSAKPIEAKREELAALPEHLLLNTDEVREIRRIGDNTGSMTLKGAAPDFTGDPLPDRWAISPELSELAGRWGIEPARDLARAA
jgi:aryl-alcohol dehydrogenase-like predicted oxidoreductase